MSINPVLYCTDNNIIIPYHCQTIYDGDVMPNEAIQRNPEHYFKRYSTRALHLVDILLSLGDSHEYICPSQSTLAKKVGCSERTIRTWIKMFKEDGILFTVQRYNDSLLYKFSSLFKREDIRSRLSHLFRTFGSAITNNFRLFKRGYKDLSINILRSTTEIWERFTKMKQYPISNYVRTQKILKLSMAGMIRLSAFADEALEFAFEKYLETVKAKNIYSPFSYVFKLAHSYCDDNGIKVDWGKVIDLNKAFDLVGTENPMVEEELTAAKVLENPPVAQPVQENFIQTPAKKPVNPPLSGFKSMTQQSKNEQKPSNGNYQASPVKALFPVWNSDKKELTPEQKLANLKVEADKWDLAAESNPLIREWTPENPFRKAIVNLTTGQQ